MSILQMDTTPRQVCLDIAGAVFTQGEGVEAILKGLRNCFQPEALDHIY